MEVPSGIFDGLSLDILGNDVPRLDFANDPSLLRPQVNGDPLSVARAGEGLAGERTIEDVDESSPGTPVEMADVREDREEREAPVGDPLPEDRLAVLSDFNCADRAVSEQDVGKDSSASACKKVESSEGLQLMGSLTQRGL